METHVKVLAILYLAFAGLSVLFGLTVLFVTGALTYVAGGAAPPGDADLAIPLIRLAGAVVTFFCVGWAVPGFVIGLGLLKRRPWARLLGLVMSALSLMYVPFGTALGVYGLWVLFHRDSERLFAGPAPLG